MEISLDLLNVVLAGVAALAAILSIVLTIYYSRRQEREREEERRMAREELDLARQEASRNPTLEVRDVSLVPADEVEAVMKVRGAKARWHEVRRELEATPGTFPLERMIRQMEAMEGYTLAQVDYDGSYPDLVLRFELRNLGRRSAYEVSGVLFFETKFLRPFQFPGLDGKVSKGIDIANVGTGRKRTYLRLDVLLPSVVEERKPLEVPLLREGSGRTSVEMIFSTPEGDYLKERVELEVPARGGGADPGEG